MDQLPNNSHRQKNAPEEPKRLDKVVKGEVTTRKMPFHKRMKEAFIAGRADTVSEYVIWDVLIPQAKDTLADMSNSFIHGILYNSGRGPRTTGLIPGQSKGSYGNAPTNYRAAFQGAPSPLGDRRDPSIGTMSQRGRANHDFQELVIPSRVEAEAIIDALWLRIQEFNAVTVADLYDLCGVSVSYTDDKYGWTDIQGAGVIKIRQGYTLDLPRPLPLD